MTDLTIPRNLVEQLCKGNCVLFVGAGISADIAKCAEMNQAVINFASYEL